MFRDALIDPEPEVRRIAIDALSRLDESAVSELIKAAADVDWQVRAQAVSRLSRFSGEQVINTLQRALKDERWQVLKEAIESLRKTRAPVAPQLSPFLRHGIADVRIAAAAAIGEIGDGSLLPEVTELLGDPDTGAQKAAARAIEQLEIRRNAQTDEQI